MITKIHTYTFKSLPSDMRWIDKIKILLFKHLFTENEKCLLNQALNLHRIEIKRQGIRGVNPEYKEDIKDLDRLLEMCENKLWN